MCRETKMAEFDHVNVLLVDPNPKIREHVKTVLREAGFSDLRLGDTLGAIEKGVLGAPPRPPEPRSEGRFGRYLRQGKSTPSRRRGIFSDRRIIPRAATPRSPPRRRPHHRP